MEPLLQEFTLTWVMWGLLAIGWMLYWGGFPLSTNAWLSLVDEDQNNFFQFSSLFSEDVFGIISTLRKDYLLCVKLTERLNLLKAEKRNMRHEKLHSQLLQIVKNINILTVSALLPLFSAIQNKVAPRLDLSRVATIIVHYYVSVVQKYYDFLKSETSSDEIELDTHGSNLREAASSLQMITNIYLHEHRIEYDITDEFKGDADLSTLHSQLARKLFDEDTLRLSTRPYLVWNLSQREVTRQQVTGNKVELDEHTVLQFLSSLNKEYSHDAEGKTFEYHLAEDYLTQRTARIIFNAAVLSPEARSPPWSYILRLKILVAKVFPLLYLWPKTCLLIFCFTPLTLGLGLVFTFRQGNPEIIEVLSFVDPGNYRTTDDRDSLFIAGHVMLWLAVYFLFLLPLTTLEGILLFFLTPLASKNDQTTRLVCCSRSFHKSLGVTAGLTLFVGFVCLSFIGDMPRELEFAFSVVPLLFFTHRSQVRERATNFMLPQYPYMFSLLIVLVVHVVVGILLIAFVTRSNKAAGWILLGSWGGIWTPLKLLSRVLGKYLYVLNVDAKPIICEPQLKDDKAKFKIEISLLKLNLRMSSGKRKFVTRFRVGQKVWFTFPGTPFYFWGVVSLYPTEQSLHFEVTSRMLFWEAPDLPPPSTNEPDPVSDLEAFCMCCCGWPPIHDEHFMNLGFHKSTWRITPLIMVTCIFAPIVWATAFLVVGLEQMMGILVSCSILSGRQCDLLCSEEDGINTFLKGLTQLPSSYCSIAHNFPPDLEWINRSEAALLLVGSEGTNTSVYMMKSLLTLRASMVQRSNQQNFGHVCFVWYCRDVQDVYQIRRAFLEAAPLLLESTNKGGVSTEKFERVASSLNFNMHILLPKCTTNYLERLKRMLYQVGLDENLKFADAPTAIQWLDTIIYSSHWPVDRCIKSLSEAVEHKVWKPVERGDLTQSTMLVLPIGTVSLAAHTRVAAKNCASSHCTIVVKETVV